MDNNPVKFTNPDVKCPMCVIALVGAAINVAAHWNSITEGGSFHWGSLASAALVGAGAGIFGAVTGGAAYASMSVGGAIGGAASGIIGGTFGSMISGTGNALVFGDSYTYGDVVKGAISGGLTGGMLCGISSAPVGGNFWDGHFSQMLPVRIQPKLEMVSSESERVPSPIEIGPTTGLQEQISTPKIENVEIHSTGFKFKTRQIPHLNSDRVEVMKDLGGNFKNTQIQRGDPVTIIDAPIKQVMNDLNTSNFIVQKYFTGNGNKWIIKFNYPIGIAAGAPTNFGMMQMSTNGTIHIWPLKY